MIRTLTINRSRWACATNNKARGDVDSMLLDFDGFMCCLGFLGEKFDVGNIEGYADPKDLADSDPTSAERWPKAFRPVIRSTSRSRSRPRTAAIIGTSALTDKAIAINDREKSNPRRESRLTTLFAKAGIKLRFVGKYLAVAE